MEMDDTFLTLLTPEGEFLRTERNNQAYQLGDEIHFFPIDSKAAKRNALKRLAKIKPIWAASAAAAILLLIGSLIPGYQDNKAYAYMSIDVNPSIELGVNRDMKVIEIKGYNEDGIKIVSGLHDWKKQDVSDVTQIILTQMKKAGYLEHDNSVVISTVHSETAVKQAEEKLNQNINEIKQTASQQKLAVTVYSGTKDEMEKAHKLGMTTGQYQKHKQESSLSQKANNKVRQKPEIEEQKDTATHPKNHQAPVTPSGQKEAKNASKPKDSHIPPGQQKKQAESLPAEKKPQHSQGKEAKEGKDYKVPPGQQKKTNDNPVQKNKGQGKEKDSFKNKGQSKKNDTFKGQSNGNNESNQKEKHHK